MSSGRRGERRGDRVRRRAATRVRCETGNPRRARPPPRRPEPQAGSPRPPRTRIYGSPPPPRLYPLSCDIFSKSENEV